MKSLIEFSIITSGTPTNYFTSDEILIANALREYAHQFTPPQDDAGRIAGWVMAKTGITRRLRAYAWPGQGYDISVAFADTDVGRSILMKRNYLYWKRDLDHIAQQWYSLWNQPAAYLQAYRALIDVDHYVDLSPGFPSMFMPNNELVVNWEGEAVRFIGSTDGPAAGQMQRTGMSYVNETDITYL